MTVLWTDKVFVIQLSLCISSLIYYSNNYSRKKKKCSEQNKYMFLINTCIFELNIFFKFYFMFILKYKIF